MRFAFVMDPLADVNIDGDTTFAFMLAAQERGHEVHYVRMQDLSARGADGRAISRKASVRRVAGDHYDLGAEEVVDLHDFDAIFMRKDPPFDVPYLHAVHLLELAEARGTLVVNKPDGLRRANEKLYSLHFESLIPLTAVTASREEILAFAEEQGGACIVKPVDGHGGEGVFVLDLGDRNKNVVIETLTNHGRERVICQQYLPEAREGDKRIILLDGEPLGGILRVPQEDDNRGNMHVGGMVKRAALTARDLEICAALAPRLRADGLWFVGLDVIGGYLTEINVTSPTGIQELSRFEGFDGAARVMGWAESRVEEVRSS